ncbi:MAG: hypothetical protein ACREIN_01735 [Candidatus Methylomirabilaceae bacterium]
MDAVEVTLPRGVFAEGQWHRTAWLRPLSGRDEAFLGEEGRVLPPALRTTALLSRCVQRLGPRSHVTPESVRALTIGDREALLLSLRRITLGDTLSCVLVCANEPCREKMDLDLAVRELLLAPYPHAQERYEMTIADNGTTYRVRFRLPTGADQEAAVSVVLDDPADAAALLLQRCVERVAVENGGERPAIALPSSVARVLAQAMADLDPQAELLLNLTCPSCGTPSSVTFDAADYFFRELSGRQQHLYREVHLLAFHYHWSEAEIMAMTGAKRRLYLGLLSEALNGARRQ